MRPAILSWAVRGGVLALALGPAGSLARAQDQQAAVGPTTASGWIGYDWLKSPAEQQHEAATVIAKPGQDGKDPFTVVNSGSLWQETQQTHYTRKLADGVSVSYETSTTLANQAASTVPTDGTPTDFSRSQKIGLQVQPILPLTLRADVHDSTSGNALPGNPTVTNGTGFSAESRLPFDSTMSLGYRSDQTGPDSGVGPMTTNTAYDAQFKQPLGKLPVTAQLKGHYETVSQPGGLMGNLPSLEQSFVWKPAQAATVQMGLRQQRYQEYPGVENQFNQALFADWSQKMSGDIAWHSYAEMLNSRGLIDAAPANPIASGANGTPQATTPGSNVNPANIVPLSLEQRTLTFSTGPSFRLHKDLSASVEYTNRWDTGVTAAGVAQEQRVSVSVKGTF